MFFPFPGPARIASPSLKSHKSPYEEERGSHVGTRGRLFRQRVTQFESLEKRQLLSGVSIVVNNLADAPLDSYAAPLPGGLRR